ncbi:MAG TPA: hypothetical protein DEO85_01365 [Maritimibacter sp.]|nr:hypothetical protein [Maritimibacter sp.]
MTDESFGYRLTVAKGYMLLFACALVTVGAIFLVVTNDSSLVFAGIELGRTGAMIAYAVVGVVAGMVAVQEARAMLRPKAQRGEIRLDQTFIEAPTSPSDPKPVRLSYKGISDIQARQKDGERCLEIKHIDGNLRIYAAAMESKTAFDRLWRSLESRVGLHRGYRY